MLKLPSLSALLIETPPSTQTRPVRARHPAPGTRSCHCTHHRQQGRRGGPRSRGLLAQGSELLDLTLRIGELGGDQVMEAPLHWSAALPIPDAHQIRDLLERAAQLLRTRDKRQPRQVAVVVEAVAGVSAGRRDNQPAALVVAQRRSPEPGALRHLADRVAAHAPTVRAQPRLKVKSFPHQPARAIRVGDLPATSPGADTRRVESTHASLPRRSLKGDGKRSAASSKANNDGLRHAVDGPVLANSAPKSST